MDYVPPMDITFGDFLRALITADYDLVPDDDRRYRVAFIEAFRKWGIYPRDVRTLSEESLRWAPPAGTKICLFPDLEEDAAGAAGQTSEVRRALSDWQPGEARDKIFEKLKAAQKALWHYFRSDALDSGHQAEAAGRHRHPAQLPGDQPAPGPPHRPARRIPDRDGRRDPPEQECHAPRPEGIQAEKTRGAGRNGRRAGSAASWTTRTASPSGAASR